MGVLKAKGCRLAAVLTAMMLAGCTENSPSGAVEKAGKTTNRYHHTVADVLGSSWPVNPGQVDQLDPLPTRENIMVVLDMSGSMASRSCAGSYGSKAEAARAVLGEWVSQVDPDTNLGLVIFDSNGVSVRTPLGRHNRDEFIRQVNETSPIGGTPLRSAIELAVEQLQYRSVQQQGYGDYRIMVITDGQHTDGENPDVPLGRIFTNPSDPTQVHTVGFCIDDSALNQPGLTVYQSAENPEQLRQGLNRVLAESASFENIEDFDG